MDSGDDSIPDALPKAASQTLAGTGESGVMDSGDDSIPDVLHETASQTLAGNMQMETVNTESPEAVQWSKCIENAGHERFISVSKFHADSLPSEYCNTIYFNCVRLMSELTVKLRINQSCTKINTDLSHSRNEAGVTRTCTGFLSYFNMSQWVSAFETDCFWYRNSVTDNSPTERIEVFPTDHPNFNIKRIRQFLQNEIHTQEFCFSNEDIIRADDLELLSLLAWYAVRGHQVNTRMKQFKEKLVEFVGRVLNSDTVYNISEFMFFSDLNDYDARKLHYFIVRQLKMREKHNASEKSLPDKSSDSSDEKLISITNRTDDTTVISNDPTNEKLVNPTSNRTDDSTISSSDSPNTAINYSTNKNSDDPTNKLISPIMRTSDSPEKKINYSTKVSSGDPMNEQLVNQTSDRTDDSVTNSGDSAKRKCSTHSSDDTPNKNIFDSAKSLSDPPMKTDESNSNSGDQLSKRTDDLTNISGDLPKKRTYDPTCNISDDPPNKKIDDSINSLGDSPNKKTNDSTNAISANHSNKRPDDSPNSGDSPNKKSSDSTDSSSDSPNSRSDCTSSRVGSYESEDKEMYYQSSWEQDTTDRNSTTEELKHNLESLYPCQCLECTKSCCDGRTGYLIRVIIDRCVIFNKKEAMSTVVDVTYGKEVKHLYGQDLEEISENVDFVYLVCTTHDIMFAKMIQDLCLRFDSIHKQIKVTEGHLSNTKSPIVVMCSYPHGYKKMISIGQWTERYLHYCGQSSPLVYVSYEYTSPACPGSIGAPVLVLGQKQNTRRIHSDIQFHAGSIHGINKSGVGFGLDYSE